MKFTTPLNVLLILTLTVTGLLGQKKSLLTPGKNKPRPSPTVPPTSSVTPPLTLLPSSEPTPFLTPESVSAASSNAGADLTVYAGEPVRLDGSASTGYSRESLPDGTWSMRWTTGDGYDVENVLKAPHVYMLPGVYTAQLTLKDAAGSPSIDAVTVTVLPITTIGFENVQTLTDAGDPDANKANLQQALDRAALNPQANEIVVPAGFTANDTIILPPRPRSMGTYVTVRVADLSGLPPLKRVTADDRGKLFKINAQPAGGSVQNQAIRIPTSANYYRFVGMEINRTGGENTYKNDIIAVDLDSPAELRPSHLIFDRILIDAKGNNTVRGFAPNSEVTSLLNSSILNVRTAWTETAAVGQWSGNGPLGIINNRLEAAAINLLVGGGGVNYSSEILDGLVFRGNHSWKDPAWVGPNGESLGFAVKNLWELKWGHNTVAAGNIFENNYSDGQSGEGILIKSAAQPGVSNPWAEVRNLDFRNNKILNSRAGFSVVGIQSWVAPHPNYANHIRFVNNFWQVQGGRGNMVMSPHYFELNHNTFVSTGPVGQVLAIAQELPSGVTGDYKAPGLKILNNMMHPGEYGAIFSSYGQGYMALDYGFSSWDARNNTLSGGIGWQNPLGNFHPADYPSLFTGYRTGDYSLPLSSMYHSAGTDGRDIGADMILINAQTTSAAGGMWGVTAGGAPLPNPSPIPSPTPAPTPSPSPPATPSPTAMVSGRVTNSNSRGLSRVTIVMENAGGERRVTLTNTFGFYAFYNVPVGGYTFSIFGKRLQSESKNILLIQGTGNIVDFVINN